MEHGMPEGFTPEDEKLAGLLIQMGVPRNVSKALVYMRNRQEQRKKISDMQNVLGQIQELVL